MTQLYKAFLPILLILISLSFATVSSGQRSGLRQNRSRLRKSLLRPINTPCWGLSKAEANYKSILTDDPQNSTACYELSRTMAAQGKFTEALSYIRKANRIEPDNEWFLLMEADIDEKPMISIQQWMSMDD